MYAPCCDVQGVFLYLFFFFFLFFLWVFSLDTLQIVLFSYETHRHNLEWDMDTLDGICCLFVLQNVSENSFWFSHIGFVSRNLCNETCTFRPKHHNVAYCATREISKLKRIGKIRLSVRRYGCDDLIFCIFGIGFVYMAISVTYEYDQTINTQLNTKTAFA